MGKLIAQRSLPSGSRRRHPKTAPKTRSSCPFAVPKPHDLVALPDAVFPALQNSSGLAVARPDRLGLQRDPSGRVSRRHAVAFREDNTWILQDLWSTNGLRVNGAGRCSFQIAPGDEIELGGITLIAESRRSMELHDLLRRWLGWSTSRLGEVDRALGDVRDMANLRAVLLLRQRRATPVSPALLLRSRLK
jgi:FHA domain-containing protein